MNDVQNLTNDNLDTEMNSNLITKNSFEISTSEAIDESKNVEVIDAVNIEQHNARKSSTSSDDVVFIHKGKTSTVQEIMSIPQDKTSIENDMVVIPEPTGKNTIAKNRIQDPMSLIKSSESPTHPTPFPLTGNLSKLTSALGREGEEALL